MKILAWNCRGLGNPRAVRALRGLIKDEDPDIIFLSETKCKSPEMEKIRQKLGYANRIYVECRGDGKRRRGGLAFLWKDSGLLALNSLSENHIDLGGMDGGGTSKWRITGVYGHPNEDEKHKTWSLLAGLNNPNLPWLCFGDFNEILMQQEKRGGSPKPQNSIDSFSRVVHECDLTDLGFTGYPFTWSNNRGGGDNVQERLDRFLANSSWLAIFPWNRVRHLHKRHSDHLPILVDSTNSGLAVQCKSRKKLWRFEKAWLRTPESEEKLKRAWVKWGGPGCGLRLSLVCQSMGRALHTTTTELKKQIEALKAQLEELMENSHDKEAIEQIKGITGEIEDLEAREEEMWY